MNHSLLIFPLIPTYFRFKETSKNSIVRRAYVAFSFRFHLNTTLCLGFFQTHPGITLRKKLYLKIPPENPGGEVGTCDGRGSVDTP